MTLGVNEHPGLSDLEAAARGTAGGIAEHLAVCEECREQVEVIRADNAMLLSIREALSERRASGSFAVPCAVRQFPIDLVPGYTLLEPIGEGGQGVVYRAKQDGTGREVAVKMLRGAAFASERQRRRFEHEAEIVSRLKHPGIVTIYHVAALPGGTHAIVMELASGVPLDRFVPGGTSGFAGAASGDDAGKPAAMPESSEPLVGTLAPGSFRELLGVFVRVCDALEHAHQRGVIHRDIKPTNILVDADGLPRVLDFGLAIFAADIDATRFTRAGDVHCSPPYAAPEVFSGELDASDVRSDVYSLGVVLYRLCTGTLPYDTGDTVFEAARVVQKTPPRPPREFIRGFPADLEAILLKSLEKEKESRYQSVAALRGDIERFLRGDPIEARGHSTWYVLRRRARRYWHYLALTAATVVVMAGIAATMSMLYVRTESAKWIAEERRREAAIARGRVLARAGDLSLAAGAVWPEVRSGDLLSEWALWDVYQRYSCLATFRAMPVEVERPEAVQIAFPSNNEIVAVSASLDTVVAFQMIEPGAWTRTVSSGGGCAGAVSHMHLFAEGRSGVFRQSHALRLVRFGTRTECATLAMDSIEPERGVIAEAGGLIAVGGKDGSVNLFSSRDWSDGDRLYPTRNITAIVGVGIAGVGLSGCASMLGVLTRSGEFFIFRIADGARLCNGSVSVESEYGFRSDWLREGVSAMAFAQDNHRVAFNIDSEFFVFGIRADQRSMALEASENTPEFGIRRVLFSADGDQLVLGQRNGVVRIVDLVGGRADRTLRGPPGDCTSLRLSPDGAKVAVCNAGVVQVWELAPSSLQQQVRAHTQSVLGVHFFTSSGGSLRVVTCGADSMARVWDATDLERPIREIALAGCAAAAATTSDGLTVALADYSRVVSITDADADGDLKQWSIPLPEGWHSAHASLHGIDFNPVTGELACVGYGAQISFLAWRQPGALWRAVPLPRPRDQAPDLVVRVPMVRFSPNGKYVAACTSTGAFILFDAGTQRLRAYDRSTRAQKRLVAFSGNSELVAVGGDDRTIRVYSTRDARCVRSLPSGEGLMHTLAFMPDDRVLIMNMSEVSVQFTDWRNNRELAAIDVKDMVMSSALSPGGDILGIGTQSGMLYHFDLSSVIQRVEGNRAYYTGGE